MFLWVVVFFLFKLYQYKIINNKQNNCTLLLFFFFNISTILDKRSRVFHPSFPWQKLWEQREFSPLLSSLTVHHSWIVTAQFTGSSAKVVRHLLSYRSSQSHTSLFWKSTLLAAPVYSTNAGLRAKCKDHSVQTAEVSEPQQQCTYWPEPEALNSSLGWVRLGPKVQVK